MTLLGFVATNDGNATCLWNGCAPVGGVLFGQDLVREIVASRVAHYVQGATRQHQICVEVVFQLRLRSMTVSCIICGIHICPLGLRLLLVALGVRAHQSHYTIAEQTYSRYCCATILQKKGNNTHESSP